MRKGYEILEVIPSLNPEELFNYFVQDLETQMYEYLLTNQQKLKPLPKMELWKKFDYRAGYYLYETYFGEAIRDSDKPIGWAVQGSEKYPEGATIKRSKKGERMRTEENFAEFKEVSNGSYYRKIIKEIAMKMQQAQKTYRPLESYFEAAEEEVDKRLKEYKRALRKKKKQNNHQKLPELISSSSVGG